MIPGVMLLKAGKDKDFVLPSRHEDSKVENTIGINVEKTSDWGISEEIHFAYLLFGAEEVQFKVLYIPIFAFIILLLTLFHKTDKRGLFLILLAELIFLIGTPQAGLYKFLYKHIFFFKYFRNMHFFLWFALLPVFLIFLSINFKELLSYKESSTIRKILQICFICFVHAALGIYGFYILAPGAMFYITLVLSLMFFIANVLGFFKNKGFLIYLFLMIIIILHPIKTFDNLSSNMLQTFFKEKINKKSISAVFSYERRKITGKGMRLLAQWANNEESQRRKDFARRYQIYYGTKYYSDLYNRLDPLFIQLYFSHKFILYDNIELIDENTFPINIMERALSQSKNVAFVSDPEALDGYQMKKNTRQEAIKISSETEQLKVTNFDVNSTTIQLILPERKFLAYNDNYHKDWHAYIDGKETKIFRTNISFKGIWVPEGQHRVEFYFGDKKLYYMRLLLLAFFYLTLFSICWMTFTSNNLKKDTNNAV